MLEGDSEMAHIGAVRALQVDENPAPAVLVRFANDFGMARRHHIVVRNADVAVDSADDESIAPKAHPFAVDLAVIANGQDGHGRSARWLKGYGAAADGGRFDSAAGRSIRGM